MATLKHATSQLEDVAERLRTEREALATRLRACEEELSRIEEALAVLSAGKPEPADPPTAPGRAPAGSGSTPPPKPPPTGPGPAGWDYTVSKVLGAVRAGNERKGVIAEATKLDLAVVAKALRQLRHEGHVRQEGTRATTRWLPSEGEPAGRPQGGRQEQTDEGKVLGALELRKRSPDEVAEDTEIPVERVRTILGNLLREGDARMFQGDLYTATP